MPFITIKQSPIYYQMSLDDILDGTFDISKMVVQNITNTRTTFREYFKSSFLEKFDFGAMINSLEMFNQRNSELFSVDRKTLYHTFSIPKKSGGLRKISAPNKPLMDNLRYLKELLESMMPATHHTSAFAYVNGRCTVDAVKRHQQNGSKWFAKLDFSDFFGSTTEEFVLKMFSMIFPFSEIVKTESGYNALKTALSLCFLDGGLPQGTPISPFITNVMMIPIDHHLYNQLRKSDDKLIYTRYADDILVSSRKTFDHKKISSIIVDTLRKFDAPFSINHKKTRYGSSSGRNWNLGLMLNKDNNITIGYRNKKFFKAMCNNYLQDKANDINWDLHDVQVFSGKISYYRSIEPEYIDYLIGHYNHKFNADILSLIHNDIVNL